TPSADKNMGYFGVRTLSHKLNVRHVHRCRRQGLSVRWIRRRAMNCPPPYPQEKIALTREVGESVYSRAHGVGERPRLFGRVVGGAEDVGELLVAEARECLADPARVLDRDAVEHAAVLPREVEVNQPALDLVYELRVGVVLRLVAAARDAPEKARPAALLAERRAEVADDVAQLARPSARRIQYDVVRVLPVPVVQKRHQNLQPL